MMKKLPFLLIMLLLFTLTSFAQTAKPSVSGLSFITGKWKTSHAWGEMEENWSAPIGNSMMCSYRCVKDGKVVFYEFITIEQQGDSLPVMSLRHFGPGNIAWEEKAKPQRLRLISLDNSKAVFERADKKQRLSFEKISMISLNVLLESQNASGVWSKDLFEYTRDFQ